MKALRALRGLSTLSTLTHKNHLSSIHVFRFYASSPQQDDPINTGEDSDDTPAFDSSDYTLPTIGFDSDPKLPSQPIWNEAYRMRADQKIFGIETQKQSSQVVVEDEEGRRATLLAKALLHAALEKPDDVEEEDMVVKEEDQKSLSVGIIGAPNAGKSALTNFMVGTKVAAVSRKTNTTIHEVLGVMTKGNTQICFFDTPGLMLNSRGYPCKTDVKVRVESAWSSVTLYDVLIVIFDVHRHLSKPDKRVLGLIKHLGAQAHPKQKRVLCMNKVDLVEVKKDLLKVANEFSDLPGYERYFMISGLKGSGVKDLTQYLMDQAVKRPWDEDPIILSEDVMKNISLEVVREKMLHHIHQEIPYTMDHRLMDWKELRDGSLRIEQHFITHKQSQRKILVGKNGSKIGRIGVEANEELRSIFKRHVHLILQVRVA
ncbi:GTP-binding protein ERG [Telopea speciosissima]|uniref:GTP-binding protein ERG n=1 Tax=Telopea speciosissima TaxID=54955 RepID=UPI001CC6158D|nr:GTP-binding protein ERG [Telopea speciosissima]